MNYSMILYMLGIVLKIQSLFMALPCLVALIYQEKSGFAYLFVGLICLLLGFLLSRKKPQKTAFGAREGFITVSMTWIVISLFGAIPFVLSGDIPNYVDALFETLSGFTTTGASILSDVEALSKCNLFWRSFTHWVGGMGVLVFILSVIPMSGGHSMHLMRSESPGPSVDKLVPRMKDTARILYIIYFMMTVIEIFLLLIAGAPAFDAITLSLGTAGTGGFAIKNSSIADYSTIIQGIITVFMILFGINFNFYFLLLGKKKKNAFKLEEVHWYLGIILASILVIGFNIKDQFSSIFMALHHAAFQVGSIITTTGYATANFDLWPELSRTILVMLMFIGACAGSTGGGMKVSRIIILIKSSKNKLCAYVHPRNINRTKLDGHAISDETIANTQVFLISYVLIFAGSMLLLAIDNFDLVTNFTAIAATLNNIGPGLNMVGPTQNFGIFSYFSKIVLMFNMLAGRLELYPLLLLFYPKTWKTK